jgi:hypothetical protein
MRLRKRRRARRKAKVVSDPGTGMPVYVLALLGSLAAAVGYITLAKFILANRRKATDSASPLGNGQADAAFLPDGCRAGGFLYPNGIR